MKNHAKNIVRALWRTGAYRRLLFALDQRVCAWAVRRGPEQAEPHTLVLAPPTGENIGDQAMLEAIVNRTPGRLVVVVNDERTFVTYPNWSPRVQVVSIPGLIHRPPVVRAPQVAKLAPWLRGATQVLVPGADTLDGGNVHASLARLSLANLAVRAGVPTRIQGFSWKGDAPDTVVAAMQQLEGAAVIGPRDPVGRRRLAAVGISNTIQVSDLAFSDERLVELPEVLRSQVDRAIENGGFVVLNTSGLIHRSHDLTQDYGHVVEALHARGLKVIFLPHVIRDWDDDLAMARSVFERFGGSDDILVEQLLNPGQVRHLVRDGQLTITGRMHLAILTLSQGVPAICLATHGKVEGLFELVDLPGLVVTPRPGCSDTVVPAALGVLDDREAFTSKLAERLPCIRDLSVRNFADR